jgi:hypothetical protein
MPCAHLLMVLKVAAHAKRSFFSYGLALAFGTKATMCRITTQSVLRVTSYPCFVDSHKKLVGTASVLVPSAHMSRSTAVIWHMVRYRSKTHDGPVSLLIRDNHSSHIVRFGSHRHAALLPRAFKGTPDQHLRYCCRSTLLDYLFNLIICQIVMYAI